VVCNDLQERPLRQRNVLKALSMSPESLALVVYPVAIRELFKLCGSGSRFRVEGYLRAEPLNSKPWHVPLPCPDTFHMLIGTDPCDCVWYLVEHFVPNFAGHYDPEELLPS